MPKGVKAVGEDSFNNPYLKKLYLPEGTEEIIQYAFGCPNLEEIYIPLTLKKIRLKAFAGCPALKRAYYPGTAEEWERIDFTDFNGSITEAEIIFSRKY
ncbi:MAG: leucine-rich repeat domain-containing protein [Ruminococcus sp.]|nr:leucine-rich repeat domain-containing protein [Ruminococcus sp.]